MSNKWNFSSILEEVFFSYIINFLNWKTVFQRTTLVCQRWNSIVKNSLLSQSIQIINKQKRDKFVLKEYFTILLQPLHIQKFVNYASREMSEEEDITPLLTALNELKLKIVSPELLQFLNAIVLSLPPSSENKFPHLPQETQDLIKSTCKSKHVVQNEKERIYLNLKQTPILRENCKKKVILYALRRGIDPFEKSNLMFEKQFALQCVSINGYVYKNLSEELQNDRDIVLAAVKTCPNIYLYLKNSLKIDEQIAIEAFSRSPEIAYWDKTFPYKQNLDFYIKVLNNIDYICISRIIPFSTLDLFPHFQDDQVAKSATEVENFTSIVLRTLDKFCGMEYMIVQHIQYAPHEVEKWENFFKMGICICELILNPIMDNRDVVKIAIENNCPGIESILLQKFSDDRELILFAISHNGAMLGQLEDYKEDKQLLMAAIRENPICYILGSEQLQKDTEVKAIRSTLKANQFALQQKLNKKYCPNIKRLDWTDSLGYDSMFGIENRSFCDSESRGCNIYFGKRMIERFEHFLPELQYDKITSEIRFLSLVEDVADLSTLLCTMSFQGDFSFVKVFISEKYDMEMGLLNLLCDGNEHIVIYLLDYKYDEYLFVGSNGSHPYIAHNTFQFVNSDGSGPDMNLYRNYSAKKALSILKHYYISHLTDKVYRYDRPIVKKDRKKTKKYDSDGEDDSDSEDVPLSECY